jgi:hypothetical protein
MTTYNLKTLSTALAVSVVLVACGGGGGSASSTSTNNQTTLSADQKAFEQFALAPNASYNVTWSLPLSGSPTNGSNYLIESHASMAASPSVAGTQALNGSTPTSLARSLSVPANLTGERYLVNGAIVVSSGSLTNASYQGTGIRIDALATDGSTIVDSTLRSNLTEVSLSGAVTAAPSEFAQWFNSLYYNSSLLSGSATWNAGSAYLRYTATEVADSYTVTDYSGTTTGSTPNPVASTTTIAALMAAGGIASSVDGATYTLSNGSISTINGVTTYISANVRPDLTTPTYRTFYQLNGNVYMGSLVKAGTVIGGSAYPVAAAGSSAGYTINYSQQIQIRLNAAAVASLSAAVTF